MGRGSVPDSRYSVVYTESLKRVKGYSYGVSWSCG